MKLLYSDILSLGTEENQETIMDCFNEQMKIADRVEIAVGYTSNSVRSSSLSLWELCTDQHRFHG